MVVLRKVSRPETPSPSGEAIPGRVDVEMPATDHEDRPAVAQARAGKGLQDLRGEGLGDGTAVAPVELRSALDGAFSMRRNRDHRHRFEKASSVHATPPMIEYWQRAHLPKQRPAQLLLQSAIGRPRRFIIRPDQPQAPPGWQRPLPSPGGRTTPTGRIRRTIWPSAFRPASAKHPQRFYRKKLGKIR